MCTAWTGSIPTRNFCSQSFRWERSYLCSLPKGSAECSATCCMSASRPCSAASAMQPIAVWPMHSVLIEYKCAQAQAGALEAMFTNDPRSGVWLTPHSDAASCWALHLWPKQLSLKLLLRVQASSAQPRRPCAWPWCRTCREGTSPGRPGMQARNLPAPT